MGFNMQKLMQQAQKMQKEVARVQAELAETQVEGSAGGGMVKAVATGSGEMVGIAIDPAAIDPEDIEMLEDLILAAIKDAQAKASELSSQRMNGVTGGMGLPGGMGGMF